MQQSECYNFFFRGEIVVKDESCSDEMNLFNGSPQPYLHFPGMSTEISCAHLLFTKIFFIRSDDHSYIAMLRKDGCLRVCWGGPADDQKARLGGGVALAGKEHSAGEKGKKVAKGVKMKIVHLSRSVWQPEATYDNVKQTIMHAQCGGH